MELLPEDLILDILKYTLYPVSVRAFGVTSSLYYPITEKLKIWIFVDTNKSYMIHILYFELVEVLRKQAMDACGLSKSLYELVRLVHRGEMHDGKSILDQRVTSYSTIHMSLRMRGA